MSYLFAGQTTLNILLTFSFSIALIYLLMWLKRTVLQNNTKQTILAWIIFILAIVGTCLLTSDVEFSPIKVDYGFWGIMLPVVASIVDNKYIKMALFSACLAILCFGYWSIQWFSLISIVLLLFYNGTRGKHNIKYLFYIYYPVHIVVIYLIALII